MKDFLTLDGRRATAVSLHVPSRGVWFADVDLDGDATLEGAVEVVVGSLTLTGTIAPAFSGVFQLGARYRVLGGAGGWSKPVDARHYHNDAGIKLSTVLGDLAREVGETISVQSAADVVIGVDFVRERAPARRTLEALLSADASWWVRYDGITEVGARAVVDVGAGVEILDYDPRTRLATLSADDFAPVVIGSRLTARLTAPVVVRELDAEAKGSSLRFVAWCGDDAGDDGRGARALRALTRDPRRAFFGVYRYRVVSQAETDGRLTLQAVRKLAGLPDVLPVSAWPGIAGASSQPQLGAIVVVAFFEGDPAQPFVTHYEPSEGAGFLPVSSTIDASGTVHIGPSAVAVQLAGGSDAVAPGAEAGRVVRYGDTIMFPSGSAATPTALPILGSAPGAVGAPVNPVTVAKVHA